MNAKTQSFYRSKRFQFIAFALLALSFIGFSANAQLIDHQSRVNKTIPKAKKGDARAQSNLGVSYQEGWGVPQDYEEAAKWFRKAAEQGYARAQYYLGILYANGDGVPKNHVKSIKWFRKAAVQNLGVAQYKLGVFYKNGLGVSMNIQEAYFWLILAAENGTVAAGMINTLEKQLESEAISKAQERVREWKINKGQ